MIRHDFEQYSERWWAVRRGKPTASEFKHIITPKTGDFPQTSAFTYACQLIADLYDPNYGMQPDYVSAAMKNGVMMEPEARRWFEFETNQTVDRVGFITTDDGRFGCSPDALVGEDAVLELKCPTPAIHVKWLAGGGLPDDHKPQCHANAYIAGRPTCWFMSYCEGFPTLLVPVEPDDYRAALVENMGKFWELKQGIERRLNLPPPPEVDRSSEPSNPLSAMLVV